MTTDIDTLERKYPTMTHRNGRPFGVPKKAHALFLDRGRFKEWVEENGGEDGLLTFVVAQVASGVSLRVLSESYVVDYGLLWAWVSEDSERLSRYELAQRGVAEYYVSEAPDIADNLEGDVARDKLRIDTRLKVAAKWNKQRYGEVPGMAINLGANSLVAILGGLPSAQIEALREERLLAGELVEGEAMEEAPPAEKLLEKNSAENSEKSPAAPDHDDLL